MENKVENRVKTLITLSEYENKILTIISRRQHISKSKLISQMIELYIETYDMPERIAMSKYNINQIYKESQIILELREKWKRN